VVPVDVLSGSHTRVGSCVHFRICVPQALYLKLWQQNEMHTFHRSNTKLVTGDLESEILEGCTQESCYHWTQQGR
jgi:hypothetical protein